LVDGDAVPFAELHRVAGDGGGRWDVLICLHAGLRGVDGCPWRYVVRHRIWTCPVSERLSRSSDVAAMPRLRMPARARRLAFQAEALSSARERAIERPGHCAPQLTTFS
jgi:hypothetical protein